MDEEILGVLAKHQYVGLVHKKGRSSKKVLEVTLKYKEHEGVIRSVQFLSKPSRHLYVGYRDIKPVRHGYGLLVLSTPRGILAGQEARKMKVGGEMLFKIW